MKPIRIAIIGFGKIAADQHVPVDRRQSALRAGRDLEPLGPGRRPDLHRLARADPQRRGPRSGRDHHAARPALRDRARMHRSPGFTACSKSRRPPASREIDDLACLAEAQRRDACSRPGTRSTIRPSTRRRRRSPASASRSMADPAGTRTSTNGIRASTGSGSRAASACSIPASTPSRSRPRSFPARLFVRSAELSVPGECADADRRRDRLLQPGGRRPARPPASTGAAPRARNGRSTSRPTDGTDGPARGRRRAAVRRRRGADATAASANIPTSTAQFVDLIDERRSLVDVAPLRLVADCLLVGSRRDGRSGPRCDGATCGPAHYPVPRRVTIVRRDTDA